MKIKKILLITLLFIAFNSNAQITKGNWMMGGAVSVSSSKDTFNGISQQSTNLSIFPNVGYFLIDKLATGASAELNFSSVSAGTIYGISPFVKYYFLKTDNKINIFSEVSYGFRSQPNFNSYSKKFNSRAGIVFFLNNSVALETAINYTQSETSLNSQNKTISLVVGLQIHLERK